MDAESRIRAIAERCGWADEVLQEVLTVLATECNAAFDRGRWIERSAPISPEREAALRRDIAAAAQQRREREQAAEIERQRLIDDEMRLSRFGVDLWAGIR